MLKIFKKLLANLKEDFRDFQEKIAVFFKSDGVPDYCGDELVAQNESKTLKMTPKSKVKEFFECLAVDVSDVDLPEDNLVECFNRWAEEERLEEMKISMELAGVADFGYGLYYYHEEH